MQAAPPHIVLIGMVICTAVGFVVTILALIAIQKHLEDVSSALAPGWTSYKYHLNYQTFDATALLQKGDNVIGAEVGEGWFSGRLGFNGGWRYIYGNKLALLAQLEIAFDTAR
jgi:hypothetical protein